MARYEARDPRALRAMERLGVRSSFEMTIAAAAAKSLRKLEKEIGSARAMLVVTATLWARVTKGRDGERDFTKEFDDVHDNIERFHAFWTSPKRRKPGRPSDTDRAIAYLVDVAAQGISGEHAERLDLAAIALVAGIDRLGNEQWRRHRVTHWGNQLRAHRPSAASLEEFLASQPPGMRKVMEDWRREIRELRTRGKKLAH